MTVFMLQSLLEFLLKDNRQTRCASNLASYLASPAKAGIITLSADTLTSDPDGVIIYNTL